MNFIIYSFIALWPAFFNAVIYDPGRGLPSITIVRIYYVIILSITLFYQINISRKRVDSFFIYSFIFIIYILLNFLYNEDTISLVSASQHIIDMLILPLALYFCLLNRIEYLDLDKLYYSFAVSIFLICAITITEIVIAKNLIGPGAIKIEAMGGIIRPSGPFGENIILGFNLLMMIPVAWYGLRQSEHRNIMLLLSIVAGLTVVFTFSRACILGLMIIVIILSFRFNVIYITLLFVCVSLILILLWMNISEIIELPFIKYRFLNIQNISGRWHMYTAQITKFYENPIFGKGFDVQSDIFPTHNSYLKVLVELGILGFLIYVNIFIHYFKSLITLWKINKTDEVRDLFRVYLSIFFIIAFIPNTSDTMFSVNSFIIFFIIVIITNRNLELCKEKVVKYGT